MVAHNGGTQLWHTITTTLCIDLIYIIGQVSAAIKRHNQAL